MSEGVAINYNSLIALGKKLARPTSTLLALAPNNDPFYAGRPGRWLLADWFAALWEEFEFGAGTHLRRVHYRLVSQANPVSWPDGKPYENTDYCWNRLIWAARDARCLGLVPVEDFIDRRNDDVIEHFADTESAAFLSVSDPGGILGALPSELDAWLPNAAEFQFIPPVVDPTYYVELWAEKTTVNDILAPLAQSYGLNVVTASGEISVTHCYQFVQRAKEIGRPVRILYVSDFDPAGMGIPVSCARKVEFFIRRDNLDLDVQVRPVVLTHDQCIEFRLPRTPIKKSEKRGAAFSLKYGEGATELDALEALHPGELQRILEQEILRYRDTELDDRIEEAAESFQEQLAATREEILDRHAEELRKIKRAYADLVRRLNPELKQIKDRYDDAYEAIRDSFDELQKTIAEELEAEAPDPELVDWPAPEEGDEDDDPLFDSTRGYVEQIDRFKRHQGKSSTRKTRSAA